MRRRLRGGRGACSRRQAPRRILRHHEAGVEPARFDEEGRQAAQARVDEEGDAALGNRAYLGKDDRHDVGADRHGLGVEIPARKDVAVVGEDDRIVGHRIRFDLECARDMAKRVEAGAHDLRLAAKRIGVLHAVLVPVRGS